MSDNATLNVTLSPVTVRASARLNVTGALSTTLPTVRLFGFAVASSVRGTLSSVLGNASLASAAKVRIDSSLHKILFRANLSSIANQPIHAQLNQTLYSQLTNSRSAILVGGALSQTLSSATLLGLYGKLHETLDDAVASGLARASTLYQQRNLYVVPGQAVTNPSLILEAPSIISFKGHVLTIPNGSASTNFIPNSTMIGSTPTTAPAGWSLDSVTTGNKPTVVNTEYLNSMYFIDIKINYTPSSSSDVTYIRFCPKLSIPTIIGDYWTESCFISIGGGNLNGISQILLEFDEFNTSEENSLTHSSASVVPTPQLLRFFFTDVAENSDAAFVWPYIAILPTGLGPINITLRIGAPQMENQMVATTFIPTSGSAVFQPSMTLGGANLQLDMAWSDFDPDRYIRQGTRIITADGGIATLIADPQFQSNIAPALVTAPFSTSTYEGLDIGAYYPVDTDPVQFVPNPFRYQTRVPPDYFGTVRENVINDVCDGIVRLGNLRQWDKIDSEYLDQAKQDIGGFFDTVMFDDDAKRRILLELPQFYTYNITQKYILFLSFLMSAQFSVTGLWTNNYKNFIPQPLDESYYPTNHVQLKYDRSLYPKPDVNRLMSLFYDLSPVPFVLDSLFTTLTGQEKFTVGIYLKTDQHIRMGTNRLQAISTPNSGPDTGWNAPINGIPSLSLQTDLSYYTTPPAPPPTPTPIAVPTPTSPTNLPPSSVTVRIITATSTSINIEMLSDGSGTISFQVQYRTQPTNPWVFILPTTNPIINLTKLIPSTSYEILVTASNAYGSAVSGAVEQGTLPAGVQANKTLTYRGLNALGMTDFSALKTAIPSSNTVIIPIYAHTNSQTSTNVSLDSFQSAWIDTAKSAGFNVVVAINLTVLDGTPSQTITPGLSLTGVQSFMTNLLNLCASCAVLAQAHGAIGFICGTELQPWGGAQSGDIGPFTSAHMTQWQNIYQAVKNVFQGWVSYAALPGVLPLADPTGPWSMKYSFWDNICTSLFPGVPNTSYTTATQIQGYWDNHPDTDPNTSGALNGLPNFVGLRRLYNAIGKKIIITEAGIVPASGAQVAPGTTPPLPPPFNYSIQNAWWTAFMNEVTSNVDIIQGVFPLSGQINGMNGDYYGIRNTPAATTINTAYSGAL